MDFMRDKVSDDFLILIGKHFQAHPDHLPLRLLHLRRPPPGPDQEELDAEADLHHPDGDPAPRALGEDQQEDRRDPGHEARLRVSHRDGLLPLKVSGGGVLCRE